MRFTLDPAPWHYKSRYNSQRIFRARRRRARRRRACRNGGSTNRFGGTTLIPASEHGHVDTVRILLAAGVPVNHVNKLGWTALQEAILLNSGGPRQQEVVRQLLAAGADPNIRDPMGRTALENAERLGFAAIAELIRGR